MGFPGGSDGKESACNAGDMGSIIESGRSPGEGHGNPLQYSCLENSTDRAWQATVHGVTRSQTQLSNLHFLCFYWNSGLLKVNLPFLDSIMRLAMCHTASIVWCHFWNILEYSRRACLLYGHILSFL